MKKVRTGLDVLICDRTLQKTFNGSIALLCHNASIDSSLSHTALKFKEISPKEKYINDLTNPPKINIEFFKNIKNLKLINCYSNEENK